jgi:membrane-associated protein
MEDTVREIIGWLIVVPAPVLWAGLLFASMIEYVFPPFPGDALVFGGGILASQGFDFVPVFLAVTLGSVLGAGVDYELGRWLARPGTSWLHRWIARPRVARVVHRFRAGFLRHGMAYLLINRFLPGVRAFFFVAAGHAGLRRGGTLLFAALGALLWNALILIVALSVGHNLDALLAFVKTYSEIAWIFVVLVCGWLLWKTLRRPS